MSGSIFAFCLCNDLRKSVNQQLRLRCSTFLPQKSKCKNSVSGNLPTQQRLSPPKPESQIKTFKLTSLEILQFNWGQMTQRQQRNVKAGWRGISKDNGKHSPNRETKEEPGSLNYCYDTRGTVESLTRGGHVEELTKTQRERMSRFPVCSWSFYGKLEEWGGRNGRIWRQGNQHMSKCHLIQSYDNSDSQSNKNTSLREGLVIQ